MWTSSKKTVRLFSRAVRVQFVGYAAVFALGVFIANYVNSDFRDTIRIGIFPAIMVVGCIVLGTAGLITSKNFSDN